jgi:hypothetical protein
MTTVTGTELILTPSIPQGGVASVLSGRPYPLHNGARRIIHFEEKCAIAEDSGHPIKNGRVPFEVRLYRMIDEIIQDPTYNKGDYITIEEMLSSPKIFAGRVNSDTKKKKREEQVRRALPSVCHAFNYYWGASSSAATKLALVQKLDVETHKVLGVLYPMSQEDIDLYLAKLANRALIAEEVQVVAQTAIKMLPGYTPAPALPQTAAAKAGN